MLTELRARRDDMLRYPLAVARQALFGTHTFGLDALGTPESVAALDATTVRDWHTRAILNGDAVLAIIGDAEPQLLAEQVAGAFDALRPGVHARATAPAFTQQPIEIIEARSVTLDPDLIRDED